MSHPRPLSVALSTLLILGSLLTPATLRGQSTTAGMPSALWGQDLRALPYEERLAFARSRGLAIWDVYAACEREGSLDSAIRAAEPNDLLGLAARMPGLQAVAHNGGESARHVRVTQRLGLPVYRLPSSSPANASWSFERKLAAWHEVFARHGLLAA